MSVTLRQHIRTRLHSDLPGNSASGHGSRTAASVGSTVHVVVEARVTTAAGGALGQAVECAGILVDANGAVVLI